MKRYVPIRQRFSADVSSRCRRRRHVSVQVNARSRIAPDHCQIYTRVGRTVCELNPFVRPKVPYNPSPYNRVARTRPHIILRILLANKRIKTVQSHHSSTVINTPLPYVRVACIRRADKTFQITTQHVLCYCIGLISLCPTLCLHFILIRLKY